MKIIKGSDYKFKNMDDYREKEVNLEADSSFDSLDDDDAIGVGDMGLGESEGSEEEWS